MRFTRKPLIFRLAHLDAATLQPPLSVLSVIPASLDVNYKEQYYNPNLRKELIDNGILGYGNGGTTWASGAIGEFVLNEGKAYHPGMCYGLREDGGMNSDKWVVGWMFPRYKIVLADYAEPMWEKLNYYSIVGDLIQLVEVTDKDAGTGADGRVIARVPRYEIMLVNDLWAYDFNNLDDEGNPQIRTWSFYGVYQGVKGWYYLNEMNDGLHKLLGEAHEDTQPASPEEIPGSIIAAEDVGSGTIKWKAVQADEEKYQIAKAGAGAVTWVEVPSTKSISKDNEGKLMLANDMKNVPANHYYSMKNTARSWKKIT